MNKAVQNAILITLLVHLAGIIVLLLVQISTLRQEEKGILLDFSALEQARLQEELKKQVAEKLEKEFAESEMKNIAVNNDEPLPDGESSPEELRELYDAMSRIDAQIAAPKPVQEDKGDVVIKKDKEVVEQEEEQSGYRYRGPSIARYTLKGRRHIYLKIPAYRCMTNGEVVLSIGVNRDGHVVEAYVMEQNSSSEECLVDEAIKAAFASRFTAKPDAPEIQWGDIMYVFIAQEQ